jgi:imidazolonepropionase-like amidohydrolase
MFESMAFTVRTAIPYGVGTDGMHGDLATDIIFLADLGATNGEALRAATINGARITGIESETGSLQPGKDADILVVAGNPFNDLRDLRNVLAVMKKGKIVYPLSARAYQEENVVYGLK